MFVVVLAGVALLISGIVETRRGASQTPATGADRDGKRVRELQTPRAGSGGRVTPAVRQTERSRFTNSAGFFEVPPYDDRDTSKAERDIEPLRDPRWPAFVACVQQHGVGTAHSAEQGRITQEDIDAIVAEINQSGHFYSRGEYRQSPEGDAFLSCEHLLYAASTGGPGSDAQPAAGPAGILPTAAPPGAGGPEGR